MKNLTNVLDELVLKLKKLQGLSSIRFVHSGRGEFAQRPVDDFLIACAAAKEEFKKENEEYKGTLEFTLYAPQGEGKRALTLLSQQLAQGLLSVDTEGSFEKITIADSSFDSNMSVWKQVVSALVAEKTEAVDEVYTETVYLGTTKITGVTSFEVTVECSAHERRELLAGEVEQYVAQKSRYTITMSVLGADIPIGALANKNVNIYRENANMTYDDCRLHKMHNSTRGGQELIFQCRRAHKGAEVTE
ncbi:MAG: hypothetical protein IJA62_06040 [Ruminococcus sp.]|nr:hypothetical protein [Ruminococcus sp.]